MCNCVAEVQKMLEKENTRLTHVSLFNIKTGKCRESIHVSTEKIDTKKKGKAKYMLVTFCPFCGERYAPQVEADAA
jgi:hypothetical protein